MENPQNQENELKWGDWNNNSNNPTLEWENNIDQDTNLDNQNNEIDWNNHSENPQNQENELKWGETTPNWEEKMMNESVEPPSIIDSKSSLDNTDNNSNEDFNFMGSTNELYYNGFLFDLKVDNSKILEEINNLNLELTPEDGRYSFNPSKDSELGKLIHILVKIGIRDNTKIIDTSIIKTKPGESFLNIFKKKPQFNFIYFAQSNEKSGEVIIDFSTIGGPSYSIKKPTSHSTFLTTNQLIVLPGWIPYRISQNKSEDDNILITGMYS